MFVALQARSMSPIRIQGGRALALNGWVDVKIQLTAQARESNSALGLYCGFWPRAGRSVTIDESEPVLGQGFAGFAASIPAFGRKREQADVVGFERIFSQHTAEPRLRRRH
jgi:hypothetical protein